MVSTTAMSKTTDVRETDREHAKVVPADVLDRLCPAELRLRCSHADEISRRSASQPPEQFRHLTAHARKLLKSMPAAEYVVECKRLSDLTSSATGDVWTALNLKRRAYVDAHVYSPGLIDSIDRLLRGDYVLDRDLADTATACIEAAGSRSR